MLKFKIDKAGFDALGEDAQKMYTEADGEFTLQVSGLPDIPDVEGLKNKVNELLSEKKEESKKRKAAEKKAADDAAAAAQNSGDVDAINTSWQTKYDEAVESLTTERDGALKMLRVEKVHSKAVELATMLAVPGSADVLLPHITSRLTMDITDGKAKAVVLDKEGKPSALTVEELGSEIANNEAFAPLIVASNSSGSGANGNKGGGAAKSKTVTRKVFDGWDASQQSKHCTEGGQITD